MAERPDSGEGRGPEPLDAGFLRAAARRYDGVLDQTLRSAVIPYGYTVTIWAAGAYLIGERGFPSLWEAFAFVSGAILAFALLTGLWQRRRQPARREGQTLPSGASHPIFGAGLHIAAVGFALACAAVIDKHLGQAAWVLAPFAVTSIYLLIAAAELAVAQEMRQRRIGPRGLIRRRRAMRRAARRGSRAPGPRVE